MELVLGTLFEDDEATSTSSGSGSPVAGGSRANEVSMVNEVAILGVGMHPWGKWGRNFVEYGVKAAQRRRWRTRNSTWSDVQFVSGGDTVRNGYPGYVAGATFAQGTRLERQSKVASSYGACATGAQAIDAARTR